MTMKIPRAVKLGFVSGSCAICWEEQCGKSSLYNNDHLEDKVVSDPYVVTSEMIKTDMQLSYLAWLKSKIKFKENCPEMEHYFEHVSLKDLDYCKFCVMDRSL